jgi:hypothetical protein
LGLVNNAIERRNARIIEQADEEANAQNKNAVENKYLLPPVAANVDEEGK